MTLWKLRRRLRTLIVLETNEVLFRLRLHHALVGDIEGCNCHMQQLFIWISTDSRQKQNSK